MNDTHQPTGLRAVFDLERLLGEEELSWMRRARAVAAQHILPVIERDFEEQHFRAEIVPELAAAGLLGMHLQGYGCAGASAVEYGLVCHELEAADSGWRTFVSVQGSLAMSSIAKHGSEEQKLRWLPPMARGEMIGCFALTESQGGSDPAAMTTSARRESNEWVLNGAKRWIGLASVANVAVVWARTDNASDPSGRGTVRGFLVPTDSAGFRATPITGKLSMRSSIQCDVRLDAVRLGDDALLPGATGLSGPFEALNEARYGIIWGAMGAARTCLEVAIARATSREVFGRHIGGTQLIQAKLADLTLEYEKGILLALHIGRSKDAGTLDPAQISVGKLNNVREAITIAGAARSILAGDGITNEFPVMRHMANLESVRTYEGTDEIHQLVIGRALTGIAAFT